MRLRFQLIDAIIIFAEPLRTTGMAVESNIAVDIFLDKTFDATEKMVNSPSTQNAISHEK